MLVNEAWLDKWPNSSYLSALPSTSDHSPLILLGINRPTDTVLFRFDNYLAKQPGFMGSVHSIWKHKIIGTSMYEVVKKLKALKPTFRQIRKAKGDLSQNVRTAKEFLEEAQQLYSNYKLGFLLQLVNCCRQEYSTAIRMKNSMLKQRAKLQWLKYGDQNSKVFFWKINARRTKQRVFQITTADGELLTDMAEGLKHTLSQNEADLLVAPITHNEVKEAIFDIAEDSAPGPDGYTSAFFKASSPIVGHEEILTGYNQANLPPRCTIKVDLQKAYDTVEWDFLLEVLKIFKFPARFIGWIEQCVLIATFFISLNGASYGFFPSACGLRQ
ncbi:UNVERIFIED_CONTAM: hypothetical protein Slati_3784600, partial [Sesamum latifolium]